MIPLMLIMRIRTEKGRTVRLWIPLFLLWILLLPIGLLTLLVLCILAARHRTHPLRVLIWSWRLLAGLRGLLVDVEDPTSTVYLKFL